MNRQLWCNLSARNHDLPEHMYVINSNESVRSTVLGIHHIQEVHQSVQGTQITRHTAGLGASQIGPSTGNVGVGNIVHVLRGRSPYLLAWEGTAGNTAVLPLVPGGALVYFKTNKVHHNRM